MSLLSYMLPDPIENQAQQYIKDCDCKYLADLHARPAYVYSYFSACLIHYIIVLSYSIYLFLWVNGDIKEVYIRLPNKQSPFNSSPRTSIESSNCNLVSRDKRYYG